MKTANQALVWPIRIAGGIILSVLLVKSWLIAYADILANSAGPGDLEHAIALEPDNATYRMRKASADLFGEGSAPAHAEQELQEVLKRNPRHAEATMDLGLLAESRGDNAAAEDFFTRAAQFDLTFKPLWTLINFYYRTNQLEKMWPEVRKALEITTKPNMLYSDVQSVYDLCWRAGGDPNMILKLIPSYPEASLGYFSYLVWHRHVKEAEEVYPQTVRFASPSNLFHRALLAEFCNLQFQDHRITQAVTVWNSLVSKGFLASTELHPERGESIANPTFDFPLERAPFGWAPSTNENIVYTYLPHAVLFEFSGKQQDVAQVLQKNLPVMPDQDYFVTWSADGRRITRPLSTKEIGLRIRFYDGDRQIPAVCLEFLAPEKERGCSVHIPSGINAINMRLLAERLAGSVRVRGTLQVTGFRTELRHSPVP